MTIHIGSTAPRFSLPDERGCAVGLPAPARPTVLIFSRGDW